MPRRECLAPTLKLRLARKNPKVGNPVEHIEIAKHRREHASTSEKLRRQTMARPQRAIQAAQSAAPSCDVLALKVASSGAV